VNRLSRKELEEYWEIAFSEQDAETCFSIDDTYKQRYGDIAMHLWICRRL
jgi:hypothetical protein